MTIEETAQLKIGARLRMRDGKTAIYRGARGSSVWLEFPPTRGALERSVDCLLDSQCCLVDESVLPSSAE